MRANFRVPQFKTIAESADFTGLAKYRIRKIVKEEKIKYIKAGKKFLINVDSLIEYLKTGDNTIKESEENNGKIRRIV